MYSDLLMGSFVPGFLDVPMVIHHVVITALPLWALYSNISVAYQVIFLINEVRL